MSTHLENNYLDVVSEYLQRLDDKFLLEDLDLLSKYIVTRFLKTSPRSTDGMSEEATKKMLSVFIKERFSFITTFVTVINSDPSRVINEA